MRLLGTNYLQASVTKHIVLGNDSILVSPNGFSTGTLVVGRVIQTSEQYGHLEMANSAMHKLSSNDIVVGALGNRAALRGHTGHLPQQLSTGSKLSLLNIGGVLGEVSSSSSNVGEPVQLEVLGALANPSSGLLNISQAPIAPAENLLPLPPVVVIAGSCMHAGKTKASCTAIDYLTKQNLSCIALKLTGVGAQKDLNKMLQAGAKAAYSFVDAGLPSTCNLPIINIAKGCLNYAAKQSPDVIVIELGDGLLGEYGVLSLINDPQLKKSISSVVFSAADPVGAWGGVQLLKNHGHKVDIVTGPCTDNQAGCHSVLHHCKSLAINTQNSPESFGKAIMQTLWNSHSKRVGA